MTVLSCDFETRSTISLPDTGVYPYAEHPSTNVWCMAWAFADEEPAIWTPDDDVMPPCGGCGVEHCPCALCTPAGLPHRVVAHINAGGEIRAWNAQFERIIWDRIMVRRYGAPPVALEQWVDSAAEAAAMALPRHLGQAAKALGVAQRKDDAGYRLMMQMCRPREVLDDGTVLWWDEAGSHALAARKGWSAKALERDLAVVREKHATLRAYCVQDVRTERAIVPALRRLTPKEREVYLLDQRVNDRGVGLDRGLILAAKHVAGDGIARANAALALVTGGEVSEVTNHKRLTTWLRELGVDTDSVAKPAVAELLAGALPEAARQALELRADAGKSSLAKLDTMLAWASAGDRARGMLLYHGASTGRWAGKGPQPQNYPRGTVADVETYIPLVLARDFDALALFAPPLEILSSLLRAMLVAAPGHELIAADFSAIEARVLNWLAGQEDVLESFRAYDRGDKSQDPYKRMAVRMGRAPSIAEVTKQDRQAGKAAELGCGFQMGWSKFITAAWDVYQVRVDEQESRSAVAIYRETHPCVEQLWDDINRAAMRATLNPGTVEYVGPARNVRITHQGHYLYVILPSGRPLVYARPRVEDGPTPWGEVRPGLTFLAVDPFTRQWGRMRTYGGHLVENVVQAVARDLIAEGMLRAEARGYPPVLSVHDEAVAEVPAGFGSVREFERILSELPEWASGCPVAAEGWRDTRYKK